MADPNTTKKRLKYAWAALLSLSVATLALTERESPWLPLVNQLVDFMQLHYQQGTPNQPAPAQSPAATGREVLQQLRNAVPGAALFAKPGGEPAAN